MASITDRQTNAGAESFNAKVKAFRSQIRGVADIPFQINKIVCIGLLLATEFSD